MTIFNSVYKSTKNWKAEYQEVEYIQSSGTQYINPGVSIANGDKFKVDIDFQETGTSYANERLILASYLSNTQRIQLGFINQGFLNQRGGSGSQYAWCTFTPSTYTNNARYKAVGEKTATQDMRDPYIFGQNEGNLVAPMSAKLYSCMMYKNDALIRDFVPCYRKADNVIGVYDVVNDVFYTNAGTGTFTKGPDVN